MAATKPAGPKTSKLNDVFVIGAGASVPYGFPTGAKLLSLLREEQFGYQDEVVLEILADVEERKLFDYAQADPVFAHEQWNHSEERGLCSGWSRKLRGSVILTIDQFLKNLDRDKYRQLGKRLMARQILASERKSCLSSNVEAIQGKPVNIGSMHSLDWIQEFLTRVDLLDNWHEYLMKTTFLTFNYDRVLEFFLTRYLVVDRHQSEANATNFVRSMNILHLNGYLGELDELPFGNLRPQPGSLWGFDALFDPPAAREKPVDWSAVSNRMRTVWEDPEHHHYAAETQEKAKAAVAKADRIFGLGTSFIPENLAAIGLTPEIEGEQVKWERGSFWATRIGISEARAARAAELLGVARKRLIDSNARDFVVDYVVL